MWTKFSDDWSKTVTCIAAYTNKRTISKDLYIADVKMNLSKIFRNLKNGHHFEVRVIFYTGSCTGSWVLHQDRPCCSLHLEPLINVLAKILQTLCQFQNLTYSWPSYLTVDLAKMRCTSPYQDPCLGQVWWWLVKRFDLISCWQNSCGQTDKQTIKWTIRRR